MIIAIQKHHLTGHICSRCVKTHSFYSRKFVVSNNVIAHDVHASWLTHLFFLRTRQYRFGFAERRKWYFVCSRSWTASPRNLNDNSWRYGGVDWWRNVDYFMLPHTNIFAWCLLFFCTFFSFFFSRSGGFLFELLEAHNKRQTMDLTHTILCSWMYTIYILYNVKNKNKY